ncbi:ABC transporter ATP-binding protein [Pontibacter virosus]|uniref:ABC-type multidrug transport system fused ATPase/permease subunit n=1 Tax=Pontibacter virosus TaxID=1765052 RepID=A0A2U1B351_9BACT|nr:ABC transporter ATP-binding protein [Pontibacter virosus]PVY43032.1 ABC-type multidrug transport system fused ATPase/permease subunit [Pontibacter virosus]
MNFLKSLVKKYFIHFTYFYVHLRSKLFIALGLSVVVGLLDGFGLTMFLPLLQMVNEDSNVDADGLGNLSFIVTTIESLGIDLTISSILIVILFFFSLKGIVKFFEAYYKVNVQQYFIKKLRFKSFDKLSNYNYKSFVTVDSGRIQNTLSSEVARVSTAYQSYLGTIQAGLMVIVYISLALLSNPRFAILVAIGGMLSNLVYKRIYTRTKETSKKITSLGHEYQNLLIQNIAFYKYLKATGYIHNYNIKLRKSIAQIEATHRQIGFYNSILLASREPLVISVVVIVIIIQVSFFSENLGLIILSLLFFYRSLNSLMTLQTQWNNFLNVSGSLSNMTSFMEELSQSQEKNGSTELQEFKEYIQTDKLSVSYDGTKVLDDITLKIYKNKTVAFVGESGSGKTTLINVLAGLIPLDSGNITIDGCFISNIYLPSYRKRIGYITQEPVIFSDSVYNNVTLWADKTNENLARFWETLKKAAISDFVLDLPDRENSPLGNNGILISGGQKQRLSIARELYKDIDILIMDEATSALDSETEKIIQDNINALKGEYTILIVAHRLSTIKEADKVILLDKGRITGEGNFEQLLTVSQKFRNMATLQEF